MELIVKVGPYRNAVLLAIHLTLQQDLFVVRLQGGYCFWHIFFKHFRWNFRQQLLIHIIRKICRGIAVKKIRDLISGELGRQDLIPFIGINIPEINHNIEFFLPFFKHDRILTERVVLCADPGDGICFILWSSRVLFFFS